MSFGFSVGDFLTVGKLIVDIISCLKDIGGAKSEYQELLRELECLHKVICSLDKLQAKDGQPSGTIDSIKYAALSCRRPLEEFLQKIKKYEKSMELESKKRIKSSIDKLRFGFNERNEIAKLQNYLNIHIGTINLLLSEHGLETLDLVSNQMDSRHQIFQEKLDDTRSVVSQIQGNLTGQMAAIEATQSMTTRLYNIISDPFSTTLKSLIDMVEKVSISTQQIYVLLVELRTFLVAAPDVQWTFFQAPHLVEDALGFKFPVPSEYDFDLLDGIIRLRFKDGPGSTEVQSDHYELFKSRDSKSLITSATRLIPGTRITMAVIISRPVQYPENCPEQRCGSTRIVNLQNGAQAWYVDSDCTVSFDRSLRIPRGILTPNIGTGKYANEYKTVHKRATCKNIPPQDELVAFRNVRISIVWHEAEIKWIYRAGCRLEPTLPRSSMFSHYMDAVSDAGFSTISTFDKGRYPLDKDILRSTAVIMA